MLKEKHFRRGDFPPLLFVDGSGKAQLHKARGKGKSKIKNAFCIFDFSTFPCRLILTFANASFAQLELETSVRICTQWN